MNQRASRQHHVCVSSPLPGRIIQILAQEGDPVHAGQSVFVVESMKMLHELRVPQQGTMTGIQARVGDVIQPHHCLATVG